MMELKNCLHTRFFYFFYVFFLMFFRTFLLSHANFYLLYTSRTLLLLFFSFYICLRAIFAFIYLPCAFLFFIFYLLSPMRSLVLSSVREKGYLCFVCCFSAYSSVCAFFSYFLFSFFTKTPFLLSPLSSVSLFS